MFYSSWTETCATGENMARNNVYADERRLYAEWPGYNTPIRFFEKHCSWGTAGDSHWRQQLLQLGEPADGTIKSASRQVYYICLEALDAKIRRVLYSTNRFN